MRSHPMSITFVPINQNMALQAAELRARYNLQLPDAFQVAIALAAGCEAFLTNDTMLSRVTELRVIVLDDLC
jgi:predicted nucleic acid-binding protein